MKTFLRVSLVKNSSLFVPGGNLSSEGSFGNLKKFRKMNIPSRAKTRRQQLKGEVKMKKSVQRILALFCTLLVGLSLVACGDSSGNSADSSDGAGSDYRKVVIAAPSDPGNYLPFNADNSVRQTCALFFYENLFNRYSNDELTATIASGYECPEDHADALVNGIVPNVIQRDGGCTEQVQFDYNEAAITDGQRASTSPEDLKACLEAGVIPDVYKDILTDVQTAEVKEYTSDVADSAVLKMTPEQMRAKALEGYFVRDAERNLVYCPQGEILRQKSIKRNGMIRYCNKLACKKCKCKCTVQKFKEADFSKDTLLKATEAKRKQLKESGKEKPKAPRTKVVKKVVRYVLHLDQNKMDNRKCLSEHPFGTMKRALGQYYFLLKGKLKVTAEMSLFCLSYNLRRAISLKGVPELVASLR